MPRDLEAGEPLLTPFPRPNHLSLLRKEKERRSRRRWAIGAALALCVSAAGGTVAAAAAEPGPRAVDAVTAASADSDTVEAATAAIDEAQTAIAAAEASVDTSKLSAYVHTLAGYDKLPVVTVQGVVDEAEQETDAVVAETAQVQAEAAAAAQKAAEEQAAAEAAAAEALAAANTVEGAQETARTMASEQYGWGDDQFSCLVSLWNKESGWSYTAQNASSGAYGIPQSLPGSKMATAGDDWQTNAATQIAWGLSYISSVYGTPCGAWSHSQSTGWY
ncbi:aggregation-promoting factor C-terminal-like domain-containing protein [Microbacterium gilvum]|uniref:Lytic transglycosylase domain-containing protein n=1 Tax=Microbacterium gilvum TaxID=1336204 RepID=A0ABP9AC60_9MICO